MGLKESYDSVNKSVYELNQVVDKIATFPGKVVGFLDEAGHAIVEMSTISVLMFILWFLFRLAGKNNIAILFIFLGVIQLLTVLVKLF